MTLKTMVWGGLALFAGVASAAASVESTYTPLDYVEATGVQWVDTGVVGRYDTRVELSVEWMLLTGDMTMLASRGPDAADGPTRVNFANASDAQSTKLRMGYGYGAFDHLPYVWEENGQTNTVFRSWERNRIYSVSSSFMKAADGGTELKIVVDGVTVLDKAVARVVDSGRNLAIFGNNIAGTVSGFAAARCYGLKIWQDGALVRDFVPVLKDGRAGFYDTVTEAFFFSASGIDLVAGPDASTPDALVDYVESDGVATYVDLEVVGKSGLAMESRMSWVEVPGDGSYVASRQGSDVRFYMYHHYQKNTIGYNYYYNSGALAQAGVVYDVRSVLRPGEQRLTVDGADQIVRTDGATVDTGLNLYLFACNKDGAATWCSKARCFGLKIWDGDALVRDLVPCIKLRKAALHDRVSGRFFYAKAGRLSPGRLATPGLPDAFVEYIEAKGDTWLDTGVRARNNVRAVGECALTQTRSYREEIDVYLGTVGGLSHNERTFLGACAADGGKRFYLVHAAEAKLWVGYNQTRAYAFHNQDGQTKCFLGTNRHAFDVTLAKGNQTVVLDGETVHGSTDGTTVDAGGSLYLFACNRGGEPCYHSNARVYGLKLWQDGALVRDYRPCIKDGVAGLYDAVANEIVYPAYPISLDGVGLGAHADGMKPVQVLEYVESDGSQWVDTGVVGRSGTVAEFKMAWRFLKEDPDVGFLGSRADAGETRFYMWHDAHNKMGFGYEGFRYYNTASVADPNFRDDPNHVPIVLERPYEVRVSFLADRQTTVVDGVTRLDIARAGDFDTGHSMYLFAYNTYGTAACPCAARLYELKLWQDGKLVRDFVPVRLACGLNALWDRVEGKVHESLAGAFTRWGPAVGDYVAPLKAMTIIIR